MGTLEPDRNQIETFGEALFRHASPTSFASVRSFLDGAKNEVFSIKAISLNQGLGKLFDLIEDEARRAANAAKKVVLCPPIATFTNAKKARKEDVADGLSLSVELDKNPDEALAKLEEILGPATCVVKSGGQWVDENGRPYDKLHGHWRLRIPARGEDELAKLELARELATDLIGGDPTHTPISHPIRWPGSWHRKGEPRLCTTARIDPNQEIDLQTAVAALEAAAPPTENARAKSNGKDQTAGDRQYSPPNWQKLIADILTAENFHSAITRLAMKLLRSGTHDAAAVNLIRGWMEAAAPEESQHSERWQARYDDVPRAVSTAREKVRENKQDTDNKAGDELPELLIDETNLPATAKELARLIAALRDFVFNGTTPARVAIDGDCMPRAVEAAPESVCVHGHEICRPMRLQREKGRPKKEKKNG
jgi:hypothetical protein